MIEDAEEYSILTPDMTSRGEEPVVIGGRVKTMATLKHMDPNKIAFTSGMESLNEGEKGKFCIIGVSYGSDDLKYFIEMGNAEIRRLVDIEMQRKQ